MGMFSSFHCREEKIKINCNVYENEYSGKFPVIELTEGRNQIQFFPSFQQVKELRDALTQFIETFEE